MGPTPQIKLSHQELFQAGMIGVARHLSARKNKHVHKLNETERDLNSWSVDINGVCGEMAVSKYLGIYYTPPAWREDDLPNGYEIRTTTYYTGHLIIRPGDKPAVYVLVVAKEPIYSIRGWLHSKEAMHKKYFHPSDNTGGECWMVPQSDLNPPITLKR